MPYAPLVTSIILISNFNYYFFHSYLNLTISLCKRSAVMPNVYKFNGQKRPTRRGDDCPISEYKPRERVSILLYSKPHTLFSGWVEKIVPEIFAPLSQQTRDEERVYDSWGPEEYNFYFAKYMHELRMGCNIFMDFNI